jgi:DNA-3-methyladenine glycosylase I
MEPIRTRCAWVSNDPLYIDYHDHEWGIPLHDDQKLFELLILEGMQAGLSWITVLRKREHFRTAFDNFDAEKMANYDECKVQDLLQNKDIIRNRLKIRAAIANARQYLRIRSEFGSFDRYIWRFAGGVPKKNRWQSIQEVPARTPESDAMSKELTKRGFKFVGTVTCYSFMQAAGMVNDHTTDCFCYHKE